jgi:hypothetical protein
MRWVARLAEENHCGSEQTRRPTRVSVQTGSVDVMRSALEASHRGWGVSTVIGVAAAGMGYLHSSPEASRAYHDLQNITARQDTRSGRGRSSS